MGAFPNARRPKTIWVGCVGDRGPLEALAQAVADAGRALGYGPDKSFKPHLTLGRSRFDSAPPSFSEALRRMKDEPISSCLIHEAVLFKSDLRPTGPLYTPLARFPLSKKNEFSASQGTQ